MGVLRTVVEDKDEFWFIIHLLLVQVVWLVVGLGVLGFLVGGLAWQGLRNEGELGFLLLSLAGSGGRG